MSEAPGSGLLRDRNFVRFWLAATTTGIGSQVTLLALPVLAVTALNADAGELGLLGFLQLLPVIVVTPFAGVIADTYSPKHISVVSMAGRGVLMGLVPLLAFLDTLSMVWLYVIGASSGCLKALGDVVQHSMLPLIGGRGLRAGHGRTARPGLLGSVRRRGGRRVLLPRRHPGRLPADEAAGGTGPTARLALPDEVRFRLPGA
ncbi:hypothetical protein GCM10010273_15100 [Streptomyces lavendulocolor]